MNLATYIQAFALHHETDFQGLKISVENRNGSIRRGTDSTGKKWATKMVGCHYGRIQRTKGMDGEMVDCFLGPDNDAKMAYVVHVMKSPKFKTYDEDKCMLGFGSKQEAKDCFLRHYNSKRFYGGVSVLPMDKFKAKVLATMDSPKKIEADLGEPQVGTNTYVHMDVIPSFHGPSVEKPEVVRGMNPDDPWEDEAQRAERLYKQMQTLPAMPGPHITTTQYGPGH